ncbi:MAG: NifU family protein [Isosphaeraceae bacterium]
MANHGQLQNGARRIEELVGKFEAAADRNLRAAAAELVEWLLHLHGTALERMIEIVERTGADGTDIVSRLGRDDLVAQLLMLHGLHPVDLETRVTEALAKVRPYLKSHGGDVELLGLVDGVVRLRLQGSCSGCPSSALTLRNAIEEAVYRAASDITGLEVLGVVEEPPASGFVPLETIGFKEQLGRVS